MELLERYLQAVRFFLSGRQHDDILHELSENLIAEMEDREAALGRPLAETEQVEILRRHGHPAVVAARYRPTQHLIGPVFFPLYLFVLKSGLAVALIVALVLAAIASALHGDPIRRGVEALLAFPGRALLVFAWTTLGFAALDRAQRHLSLVRTWDPRSLPRVIRHRHEISRRRTLVELFFLTVGAIWLLLLPGRPSFVLGPLASNRATRGGARYGSEYSRRGTSDCPRHGPRSAAGPDRNRDRCDYRCRVPRARSHAADAAEYAESAERVAPLAACGESHFADPIPRPSAANPPTSQRSPVSGQMTLRTTD